MKRLFTSEHIINMIYLQNEKMNFNFPNIFLIALISCSMILTSCSGDDSPNPDNTDKSGTPIEAPLTSASHYYYTVIELDTLLIENGIDGYIHFGGLSSGSVQPGRSVNLTSDFITQTDRFNDTHISASSNITFLSYFPEDEGGYDTIVSTGFFPYGKQNYETDDLPIPGVIIQEYDTEGTEWSTELGAGDQTNSLFEVTSFSEATAFGHTFEAEFNAILYDGNGNTRTIKGGFAKGLIAYPGM